MLRHINNEEKKITKTANRILTLLIESHGHVVEREHLLEQVWESHGLVSSNGSLNQYISILRKTLTSLTDIEDIIVSIPKVGFIISRDIEILQLEENKILANEISTKAKAIKKNVFIHEVFTSYNYYRFNFKHHIFYIF